MTDAELNEKVARARKDPAPGPVAALHAAAREFCSDFERGDDGSVVSLSDLTTAAIAFTRWERDRQARPAGRKRRGKKS